ncbi:hypothetical protein LPB140_08680 [Sphingorhabdus lutea]|uniref:DNA polymerase III subunit chi n=1 Tax=Sphingorhabdus lutea TaxID=1913578 RepID=A0A1L3JCI7_9SPHN|nr:DNA polymerase III subunit chi [Sphingorhabdus lutea]APG62855.1 hypothetical protein LPB140_08680 [Sphingorhabdus lutea]
MRVDFYQLQRDPAPYVLPQLAQKILEAGERLHIKCADAPLCHQISDRLWTQIKSSFLPNCHAQDDDAAKTPIVISPDGQNINGANLIALADGVWDALAMQYARVLFLFLPEQIDNARATWRELDGENIEKHYWKQLDGKWVKGP